MSNIDAGTVTDRLAYQITDRVPVNSFLICSLQTAVSKRRNDIVSFALGELRRLKENNNRGIAMPPGTPHGRSRPGSGQSLPELLTVSPTVSNILADMYTLTSYIIHLTSTGNPHVVASILFHVLPELPSSITRRWAITHSMPMNVPRWLGAHGKKSSPCSQPRTLFLHLCSECAL